MNKIELYEGKYQLEFSEAAHRYKVNGEFKPGVTSMLKMLDKGDSLLQWAVNCGVECMIAGGSPDEAKSAWKTFRDNAGNTGKKVHAWIENYIAGEEAEVTPDMKPAVDAYLKWEADNQIKHLDSERVVYSEQYGYCGTVDDVHESGGKRVINDYKTGKPDFEYDIKTKRYTGKVRPRLEHLLQDALYDQAIGEESGEWADEYSVTYITKEGKLYFFKTDRVKQLRELALAVVQVYGLHKSETFNNLFRRIEQ